MNFQLRAARVDESDWLYRLKKTAYFELVEHTFGSWDESFQRRYFDQQYSDDRYEIVEVDGKSVGAMAVMEYSDYVFLAEIQLLPEFQNRGIGTAVISDLLSKAKNIGKPVHVQLLKGNRVVSLYQRLGFSVYEETKTHYKMKHFPIDDNRA